MTRKDPVNILLVDDQPAKLLSLATIVAELGENLMTATSADEALARLLRDEVAVVLVDVCMPKMDGFELAELIRSHPRCRRTAIIFISAVHLTDADRLKGYDAGAVDYLPVPIIPAMLKAKVAVFADLYRKTDQLERLNRELESRVTERTAALEASNVLIRQSEQRYRQLVHGLPAAVYTCDAAGRITLYNEAAAELWGRRPEVDQDEWCGSWKIFNPDGTPLELSECPMAVTLREGRPVRGREIIVERPDGTRRNVMPYPEPILDESGKIVGAVNMLSDVTEHRAQQAQLEFQKYALDQASIVAITDVKGTIIYVNDTFCTISGYAREELIGQNHRILNSGLHPREFFREMYATIARGGTWRGEIRNRRKDGTFYWVDTTIVPSVGPHGRPERYVAIRTDITARKEAEEALRRHRDELDELVKARTAELERSNERLRVSDRMATIGTLSAGLGHDMGNLLLPVRMRLDAIESQELPESVREDLAAIREATEYLRRLAGSLRLLAIDPQSDETETGPTDLTAWWKDAEGMIRNGLPRSGSLVARIAPGLPRVRVGRAGLTQMIFNLVQNAGDSIKGRDSGAVSVAAEVVGDRVRVSVEDNGAGMTDEVRNRCLEPFFTTKTRGLSTGLGLTLVSGIIKRVGGTIQIRSEVGRGTCIEIDLPAIPESIAGDIPAAPRRSIAMITMRDRRLQAHVESVLSSLAFEIRGDGPREDADLWVTDSADSGAMEAARRFANSDPGRRALIFGGGVSPSGADGRVVCIEPRIKPSALRDRICGVLSTLDRGVA